MVAALRREDNAAVARQPFVRTSDRCGNLLNYAAMIRQAVASVPCSFVASDPGILANDFDPDRGYSTGVRGGDCEMSRTFDRKPELGCLPMAARVEENRDSATEVTASSGRVVLQPR